MNDNLGKRAEQKIREWLDRPASGYSFDRIPDQMTGFYGSKNICDFTCYKYPTMHYIESKATTGDRFDFSMITDAQYNGLLRKSEIVGVKSGLIILFASHKRSFWVPISEIALTISRGHKSLNIKKLDSWDIKFTEISTVPNPRKKLLDYTGEIDTFV